MRCPCLSLQGLSGHADRDELLRWVGSAPERPRRFFLVHGDPPSSAALADTLRQRFGVRCDVPALDDEYDLSDMLHGL